MIEFCSLLAASLHHVLQRWMPQVFPAQNTPRDS